MGADAMVSVIIPNYNYAAYLGQAIDSALGQLYPAVEVLVVDDGSTDGSEAVLRGYGDRIRWVRQARVGVSAARNRGIQESRGALIAFLDADDMWKPEKLARQVALLEDPRVGMVFCGIEYVNEVGRRLNVSVTGRSGQALKEIALLRWPGAPGIGSTALIRKACFDRVGGFDPQLSTSADWDLWRRLACHYELAMVHEPLVGYRMHDGSMHRSIEVFERDMLLAFSRAFRDPAAAAVHPLRRRCYGNLYLMLSGSYLQAGRWDKSLAYAARSLLVWPPSLGYLAALPLRRFRRHRQAQRGRDAGLATRVSSHV